MLVWGARCLSWPPLDPTTMHAAHETSNLTFVLQPSWFAFGASSRHATAHVVTGPARVAAVMDVNRTAMLVIGPFQP